MINLAMRQSEAIEALRFPLIVLVVFIHVLPQVYIPLDFTLTPNSIYLLVSELLSHNIGAIAVPCFFLISGYYFFVKMQKSSKRFYVNQVTKRIRTILLPFVLWNLIYVLVILSKNYVFNKVGLAFDIEYETVQSSSLYRLFWSGPVNYPLWYLRDLICMVLLAPMFYFFLRYLGVWGLLILMIWNLSDYTFGIPGFTTISFLYFGFGAYFAIYKKNILETFLPYRQVIFIITLVLLGVSTYLNGREYHLELLKIFTIFGVVSSILLTDLIIRYNDKVKRRLLKLSSVVFFVYVTHVIYIINWMKGAWARFSFGESGWGKLIGYFAITFSVVFICIVLYLLLKRLSPKAIAFSIGGRISSK